ncbi:MAG: hypothetical protein JWR69_1102, partial [Pedosphaera sp.]|nr:hypothetical protein [Pedosphaera sp.]
MRVWRTILVSAGLIGMVSASASRAAEEQPFPQEAYVWQRAWTAPVREAVAQHAADFSGLTVLAAEVTWKAGKFQVVRVPVDYPALSRTKGPVGLALRIAPYPGPFMSDGPPISGLAKLAQSLVVEARAAGLAPCELQVDFDCAEAKLEGYKTWLETIRRKLTPLPVVITALPSWLNQNSFPKLAGVADGYILQVHSLERPKGPDAPFSICDPTAARRAVERAGRIGLPFRVALPTYGYVVAFGSDGHLLGLSAEGPSKNWPTGTQLREVRTDPTAIAELVRGWSTNRPAAFQKIIWYRLPISLDVL